MKHPVISHSIVVIGVPCYNEEAFIRETLDSIKSQTWTDFAVIISDNDSNDRTGEICRSVCEDDNRFHYFKQSINIGSAQNFNFIADHSESKYLLWLGAHDLLHPSMLEHHVGILEQRPEVSVSQSTHAWVDVRDELVDTSEDGDLDFGVRDDERRYLKSVGRNLYNIGANSLIRRSMLENRRFTGVVGTDRVLLSHLAFRGPFATSRSAFYFRRTFDDARGDNPYMERLTGRAGAEQDWEAFAEEYDRDFATLLGDRADAPRLRRKLQLLLRYNFPVHRNSLVTRALWTVRRFRKLWEKLSGIASRTRKG